MKDHYFTPILIKGEDIRAFIIAIIVCFLLVSGLCIFTRQTENSYIKTEELIKLNNDIKELKDRLDKYVFLGEYDSNK